jgi:hypothetical protein
MEFMLLWIDDLDDALGALRHLAPRILGFLAATALFAATGFALAFAPHIAQALIAVVLCASLLEAIRRRRMRAVVERDPLLALPRDLLPPGEVKIQQ